MNLSSKNALILVFGIGVLIVLFGIVVVVFKLNIDSNVSNNATSFMFIIAAGLFFYSKNKKKKESAQKEALESHEEDQKNI